MKKTHNFRKDNKLIFLVPKFFIEKLSIKDQVFLKISDKSGKIIVNVKKRAGKDFEKLEVKLGRLQISIPKNLTDFLNFPDQVNIEFKVINSNSLLIEITKPEPTSKAGNCKVIGKAVGV